MPSQTKKEDNESTRSGANLPTDETQSSAVTKESTISPKGSEGGSRRQSMTLSDRIERKRALLHSESASHESSGTPEASDNLEDNKDAGSHNTSGESESGLGEKKRRRSTREVKRPKFDDELVDSGTAGLNTQKIQKRLSSERASSISIEVPQSSSASVTPVPTPVSTISPVPSAARERKASVSIGEPAAAPVRSSLSQDRQPTTAGPGPGRPAHSQRVQKKSEPKEPPAKKTKLKAKPETSSSSKSKPQPAVPTTKMGVGLRKRNTISIEDRQAMEDALIEEENQRLEKKRRDARIASKDIRAKELAAANEAAEALSVEDLRAWTAADDVALVTAVAHICDIMAVHANIVFSKEYTASEIQERWYQLMYDETLSRQAKKRMNELPIREILRIQSKTVFSEREEELLCTVPVVPTPDLATMGDLLGTHPEDFHSARTPQVLLDHWHLLKMSGLIKGNVVTTSVRSTDWDRIEKHTGKIGEGIIADPTRVQYAADACEAAEKRWAKVLVEPVVGIVNDSSLREGVVATIRGRVVMYLMRTNSVVLGRSTPKATVDVNLALEGPALKISRRQAIIEKNASGEFTIENIGVRPIYVDGNTLLQEQKTDLRDGSVIEIALLRLVLSVAAR